MPKRNIPLARPDLGDAEWHAIRESLESGWVTQGPKVAAFERAFAQRHAASHAVAVNNCTAGLHLALLAIGVGPGDEVIVPAFTWVATANAVVYCGATPVFVDIDDSFNLDPAKLAAVVTSRTKAVIAVHLFGLCADIDAIRAALPKHVAIVEDAACAAGANYRGRSAGTLGRIAAFSFHPRKSVTTGEGGMITTAEPELATRLRILRNHGLGEVESTAPHDMPPVETLGYNYRLTDIQAAIGLVQLAKLDRYVAERAQWATYYGEHLGRINWLRVPVAPKDGVHAWQSYVVQLDRTAPLSRNEFSIRLAAAGIATRPGTQAVPGLGYYRKTFGMRPEDFPRACEASEFSVSIPLHNRMGVDDYRYVVETIAGLASQ